MKIFYSLFSEIFKFNSQLGTKPIPGNWLKYDVSNYHRTMAKIGIKQNTENMFSDFMCGLDLGHRPGLGHENRPGFLESIVPHLQKIAILSSFSHSNSLLLCVQCDLWKSRQIFILRSRICQSLARVFEVWTAFFGSRRYIILNWERIFFLRPDFRKDGQIVSNLTGYFWNQIRDSLQILFFRSSFSRIPVWFFRVWSAVCRAT